MGDAKRSPREVYDGLRSMALGARPEQIGVDIDANEPYIVLMETGYPGATVTVVAVADGSASIYFSSGGGFMGGAAHESIRRAAKALVDEAGDFIGEMRPTVDFPLPEQGKVAFYVVTAAAVYTAVDEEQALGLGQSALTPLFFVGQRVITEYRLISGERE